MNHSPAQSYLDAIKSATSHAPVEVTAELDICVRITSARFVAPSQIVLQHHLQNSLVVTVNAVLHATVEVIVALDIYV